jgi:PAS domain S-box-containing protein
MASTEPATALDRAILETLPHPVYVVDQAGVVAFANRAAAAALGYADPGTLIGSPGHEIWHCRPPDGGGHPVRQCPMLPASGASASGEDEWFLRRDGSRFPVAWSAAPVPLPGGPGVVIAFADRSEQHAALSAAREAAAIEAAASRAAQRRILDSAHRSRHELARDLHDGAQQRLVNLLISLQLAGEQLSPGSSAQLLLQDAVEQAVAAVDELRELASGIHPSVLTSRGLVPAVESLAARAVLPVRVEASVDTAIPARVQTAAYFLIAEALTNVAKHAQASQATVQITVHDELLLISVSDDGIGGARPGGGSGLLSLADRATALGGELSIDSPVAGGTHVQARLPLVDSELAARAGGRPGPDRRPTAGCRAHPTGGR